MWVEIKGLQLEFELEKIDLATIYWQTCLSALPAVAGTGAGTDSPRLQQPDED